MSELYSRSDFCSRHDGVAHDLQMPFSPQEKAESFRFAADNLERLYADGNAGFYASELSRYYVEIAFAYAPDARSAKNA